MTSNREQIVRWQSAQVRQNNSRHSKLILMVEYFWRSSHVNGKGNSVNGHVVVYPWYGIMDYELTTTTQETHVGVEGGSLQTLVQWWEAARKANKSDPKCCIQFSLLWDYRKFRKKVEGRSKLRRISRMGYCLYKVGLYSLKLFSSGGIRLPSRSPCGNVNRNFVSYN